MFNFDSILGLDPSAYEAIIAAFIVLGLIQTLALRRKWHQAEGLKDALNKVTSAATKAILNTMTQSIAELTKMERRTALASARADAMQERAEIAERQLMEAQADHDDAEADARGTALDPETLHFGDSHFAAHNGPATLGDLFAMLDGKGRNGAALDELIFGSRPNVHVVHGGDFIDEISRGGTFNRAPGEPESYVTAADLDTFFRANNPGERVSFGRRPLPNIEDYLRRGDMAGAEKVLGAKCVGIEIIGQDGKEIVGAEKDALIREFFGADFARGTDFTHGKARPSFDLDPVSFGTQVHEEIERNLANSDAARTFGPDSGGQGRPDESCSTQEPRSYPASSPRAG